jgi:HlyD family secretion protein
MKRIYGFFILPCVLLLNACTHKNTGLSYEFARIRRGDLEKTVSSTGTLTPVATVKVLPQMSGKVESVLVDFNDPVRKGDVLAELNTDMLRLQREQQLAQVFKGRANYELQQVSYRNQEVLAGKNLISGYELKSGKTSLDIQRAELAAAEASLKEIETKINQYAFIISPISGIVLDRNINEGDTVVDSSSSNSSSIFTLAENLEEMQIESWVGELDIASIAGGQSVRFTLEALPGRVYSGVVESRRLAPSVQDNVVSYKVIINVDNSDGSLLPGMTCSVEFIEGREENVLIVPNAALRYQPAAIKTENTTSNSNTNMGGLAGLVAGPPRMPGYGGGGRQGGQVPAAGRGGQAAETPPRTLWYLDDGGRAVSVLVRSGISDGSYTAVRGLDPSLELEGREIILRERVQ